MARSEREICEENTKLKSRVDYLEKEIIGIREHLDKNTYTKPLYAAKICYWHILDNFHLWATRWTNEPVNCRKSLVAWLWYLPLKITFKI